MKEVISMIINFQKDRPTMDKNNSSEVLLDLLGGEFEELREAFEKGEGIEEELADVLIFAITLGVKMGFDVEGLIREKVALNIVRYEAKDFQDGDFYEARKRAKERSDEIKKEFYSI